MRTTASDQAGIRRDTAYFFGYQFVAVGIISLWPQEQTNYSHKIGFDRWAHNVTHPHWDTDGAFVNLELARLGYADVLSIPPNVTHAGELREAVTAARQAELGLWGACESFGAPGG